MIGAFVVVEIACMFGQTRQHSNYQMDQMDGSDSFSMANSQQCIHPEAPKMATTVQV
jgi:hypothetical protein